MQAGCKEGLVSRAQALLPGAESSRRGRRPRAVRLGGPVSPTCRGDRVCQRALEQKLPSNTTGLGHRVSGAHGAHCGVLIPLLRARVALGTGGEQDPGWPHSQPGTLSTVPETRHLGSESQFLPPKNTEGAAAPRTGCWVRKGFGGWWAVGMSRPLTGAGGWSLRLAAGISSAASPPRPTPFQAPA